MRMSVGASILVVVVTGGCASTELTAFKDPDFADTTYRRLVVIAEGVRLDWRDQLECRVVAALNDTGTEGVVGTSVFLPTRTYDDDGEIDRLLKERGIDALLRIKLTEASQEYEYVPPTYSGPYWGPDWGFTPYPYETSGYYVSQPVLHFETRLQDQATGRTAWIASSVTTGNTDATLKRLAASLAAKLVKRLMRDGLILPPQETND